jgi:hypothetical protein
MVTAAGILDGRKATSDKFAWSFGTNNKGVSWMAKA